MLFFDCISSLVLLFLLSSCPFFSSRLTTQNTSGYLCLLFLWHRKATRSPPLFPSCPTAKVSSAGHTFTVSRKKKKKKDKNTLTQHSLNLLTLIHFFQNIHHFNIVYIFIYIQCFSFHNGKSISKYQRFFNSDFIHVCIFRSFITEYHICLWKTEILKIDKTLINILENWKRNAIMISTDYLYIS